MKVNGLMRDRGQRLRDNTHNILIGTVLEVVCHDCVGVFLDLVAIESTLLDAVKVPGDDIGPNGMQEAR